MNSQDSKINSIEEELDAESLVLWALDNIDDHQAFRLLNPLLTGKKLIVWEIIENKIEEANSKEKKLEVWDKNQWENFDMTKAIDELKEIRKIRNKLFFLRDKIIFYLLSDSENGLLDMLSMKIFPEIKLLKSSIRESLYAMACTVWPENWTWLIIERDQITLEIIKEIYEKLNICWWQPEEVVKQIREISNATLAIQEQIEFLEGLQPVNNMVLDSLRKYREKIEWSLSLTEEIRFGYKQECRTKIEELKNS